MENTNIPDILAAYIDAVIEGKITTAEFLAKYPENQGELAEILDVAFMLHDAPVVMPRPQFQQAARARVLSHVALQKAPKTRLVSIRSLQVLQNAIRQMAPKVAMVTTVLLVGLILLGGGVAFAADGANPGDPLYAVDLAVEQARLALTFSFPSRLELQMDYASERVMEAADLAKAGKEVDIAGVLANYDTNVDTLTTAIKGYGKSETADSLTASLDQALSLQSTYFDSLATSTGEKAGFGTTDDTCDRGNADKQHPVGLALAEQYVLDYGQVMEWFCGGHGFGTIAMTLEAAQVSTNNNNCGNACIDFVNQTFESGKVSWGQLLGNNGKPDELPGNSGDAGKPDKEPADNPENNPQDENVPAGKPPTNTPKPTKTDKPDETQPPPSDGDQESAPGDKATEQAEKDAPSTDKDKDKDKNNQDNN